MHGKRQFDMHTPLDTALELLEEIESVLDPVYQEKIAFIRKVMQLPTWEVALPDHNSAKSTSVDTWIGQLSRKGSALPPPPLVLGSCAETSQLSFSNLAMVGVARTKFKQLHKDDLRSYPGTELPAEVITELDKEFSKLNGREFDVFKVAKLSEGRPLQFVLWKVLKEWDLFSHFKLVPHKVEAFAKALELRYEDVPYHNKDHAADVLQSMHYILKAGLAKVMTDLEILATLLAAACHDVEHNGVNNNFHVQSHSTVAIIHNDQSVLENHHITVAWELLYLNPKTNIVGGLSADELSMFRGYLKEMILNTDMQLHMELLQNFKSTIANCGTDIAQWHGPREKSVLRNFALHAADISNPTKPRDLNNVWCTRVLNEFFGQGDQERQLGLTVTFDRENWDIPSGQIGFFNFAAVPTFDLLSEVLPELQCCCEGVQENLAFWEAVGSGQDHFKLEKIPYEIKNMRIPDVNALREAYVAQYGERMMRSRRPSQAPGSLADEAAVVVHSNSGLDCDSSSDADPMALLSAEGAVFGDITIIAGATDGESVATESVHGVGAPLAPKVLASDSLPPLPGPAAVSSPSPSPPTPLAVGVRPSAVEVHRVPRPELNTPP